MEACESRLVRAGGPSKVSDDNGRILETWREHRRQAVEVRDDCPIWPPDWQTDARNINRIIRTLLIEHTAAADSCHATDHVATWAVQRSGLAVVVWWGRRFSGREQESLITLQRLWPRGCENIMRPCSAYAGKGTLSALISRTWQKIRQSSTMMFISTTAAPARWLVFLQLICFIYLPLAMFTNKGVL